MLNCNLNFIKPSRLEDKLDIFSELPKNKIKMHEDIFVKENLILTADVHLATINKDGKPTKCLKNSKNN